MIWLSLVFSFLSQASAATVCTAEVGGDRIRISVAGSSASVQVNGRRMNRIGNCWREDRPGTRHVRCSYSGNGYRLEVYPWAETTSGKRIGPNAVVWNGEQPAELDLNCR